MAVPVSFLAHDLSNNQRATRLQQVTDDLGWQTLAWPQWLLDFGWSPGRSMAFAPTRTIYIAESALDTGDSRRIVPLVAHELTHAWRAEYHAGGRWLWTFLYVGGYASPLLTVSLIPLLLWLLSGWVAAAATLLVAVCGTAFTVYSALFRLEEEVRAEAVETYARFVVRGLVYDPKYAITLSTMDRLYKLRYPYLIPVTKEFAERVFLLAFRTLHGRVLAFREDSGL